jgi:pimeloyl-ACP methyl ester carboxylesterase
VIAREVPAYVLRGAFDWITSCEDSELIVQYVNANTPGASRFVEAPETGHGGQHYASMADAFAGKQARSIRKWFGS